MRLPSEDGGASGESGGERVAGAGGGGSSRAESLYAAVVEGVAPPNAEAFWGEYVVEVRDVIFDPGDFSPGGKAWSLQGQLIWSCVLPSLRSGDTVSLVTRCTI